ncbi:MAG: porin family protein [Spirochaetes bacterium]|nr:porin family protein [Spirochaetota bacterium]
MKKLFLSVVGVVLCLALPAFSAPTSQGNFVVTMPLFSWASGGGDLYEVNGDKLTTMWLGLGNYQSGVEWFAIDNLAIGGVLGYFSTKLGDITESSTEIGPMVSYYYAMGQLIPYVAVGYLYEIIKEDDGQTTTETTESSLFFKIGAAHMLGNNLSIYGEFAYSMDKSKPEDGESVDGNVMAINIGIKAFF